MCCSLIDAGSDREVPGRRILCAQGVPPAPGKPGRDRSLSWFPFLPCFLPANSRSIHYRNGYSCFGACLSLHPGKHRRRRKSRALATMSPCRPQKRIAAKKDTKESLLVSGESIGPVSSRFRLNPLSQSVLQTSRKISGQRIPVSSGEQSWTDAPDPESTRRSEQTRKALEAL